MDELQTLNHELEYRWFRLHIVPIRGTAGVEKWYGSATDIEDLRSRALTPA